MFTGFVFLVFAILTFILKHIFSSHLFPLFPVFTSCFSLPLFVAIVIDFPHLFLVRIYSVFGYNSLFVDLLLLCFVIFLLHMYGGALLPYT